MAGRLTDDERADRKMSEKTLNARVLYRAKKYGWRVVRIQRSMVGGPQGSFRTGTVKGFPDLVLFKPLGPTFHEEGGILFRELKKELGKLDPEQEAWRDLIRSAGGDWGLWRPSDLRTNLKNRRRLNRG
jgi:hypothetical protein